MAVQAAAVVRHIPTDDAVREYGRAAVTAIHAAAAGVTRISADGAVREGGRALVVHASAAATGYIPAGDRQARETRGDVGINQQHTAGVVTANNHAGSRAGDGGFTCRVAQFKRGPTQLDRFKSSKFSRIKDNCV